MKNIIKSLLLFSLPIVAVCMGLFFVPYDKKFAYNYLQGDYSEAHFIYNRMFENTTPVDVAFFGSSHTHNGINDSLIENRMHQFGLDLKIANLGLSHKGRNVHYVIAKDLLKIKKPKVIIVEVLEGEEIYSHFAFPIIGDAEDVVAPVLVFNRMLFRDYSYGLQARYDYLRKNLTNELQYSKIDNIYGFAANMGEDVADAPPQPQPNDRYLKTLLKKTYHKHMASRFPKQYVKKLYEVAKQNGAEVVFLYIPSSTTKMELPSEYEFYKTMGKVLIPPSELFANKDLWADPHHFNPQGANLLSEWVSQKIASEVIGINTLSINSSK